LKATSSKSKKELLQEIKQLQQQLQSKRAPENEISGFDILSGPQSGQLPFFVIVVDKKRIVRGINKILPGYKKEDVIGSSSDQFISKEFLPLHIKKVNSAFKNKRTEHFMLHADGENGTKSWYETYVIPIIKKGKVVHAYTIAKDISAEKNAELESFESKISLDIIFQQLPFSIWTVDKKRIITSLVGPGLKETSKKYIGKDVISLLRGDNDKVEILNAISGALRGKKIICDRHSHGKVFQQYIEPLKDKNGKIQGAVGVSIDVTEKNKTEAHVKESEERFKALSESAFEGIAFSENGKIIDANEQFAKIHGYGSAKEIIGLKVIDDFVVPEMQKEAYAYKTGKKKGKMEVLSFTKDKSRVFLESKGKDIKFKNRKIRVTVAYDITQRKANEMALRESERALSTLMNNLPGMAYRCLYDKSWTMLFLSNGCEKLTGYKEEDVIFNKKVAFADLVFPQDREIGRKEIKEALQNHIHFEIQYRIVSKKKKIKWIWEKGEGVFDDKGKLLFIEGFIADITERKEQELRLNQSRETYQNLVEQSPQGTFIHDYKGKILYANRATLDILGIKNLSKVKNLSMFDWILPEYHGQIAKDKDAILAGKQVRFKLSKINTEKGTVIDVEYKPITFVYNGKPAVLVVFHDISMERKLNEERLRAEIAETANIQLQREILERKVAEEKVRHSLKEKEILLKEVHHRVKNNLQVISSILNLQSSYVSDNNIKNLLRESQNRIKSMAFIHESLYQTKDFSGIKFSDYIVNLSNNLVHTYISTGEKVELELKIEEVFLNLDSAIPCGLILNELVSNTLKYAFPASTKGALFIGLLQKDDEVEIIVKDNGRGLPAEVDYRNTQSLGLQLVITLVDQMNGKIELDNTAGANFRITFKQSKKIKS